MLEGGSAAKITVDQSNKWTAYLQTIVLVSPTVV